MNLRNRLFTYLLVVLLAFAAAISRADDWQLLPFVKADAANPCLAPRPESEFDSPLGGRVKWEEAHVFNPAVAVRKPQSGKRPD